MPTNWRQRDRAQNICFLLCHVVYTPVDTLVWPGGLVRAHFNLAGKTKRALMAPNFVALSIAITLALIGRAAQGQMGLPSSTGNKWDGSEQQQQQLRAPLQSSVDVLPLHPETLEWNYTLPVQHLRRAAQNCCGARVVRVLEVGVDEAGGRGRGVATGTCRFPHVFSAPLCFPELLYPRQCDMNVLCNPLAHPSSLCSEPSHPAPVGPIT